MKFLSKALSVFLTLFFVLSLIPISTPSALAEADLTVTAIGLSNTAIYDGDSSAFYAVVRNSGETDVVGNFNVDFFVDGKFSETVIYKKGIASGAMAIINSAAYSKMFFGAHSVTAIINSDGKIADTDNSNNRIKSRISVIDNDNPQNTGSINASSATSLCVEAESFNASNVAPVISGCDEGGNMLADVKADNYFDYSVNVPSDGEYHAELRVMGAGSISILSGNTVLSTISFEGEGWNNFITASTVIALQQGLQTIRLRIDSATGVYINYFVLSKNVTENYDSTLISYNGAWVAEPNTDSMSTTTANAEYFAEFKIKGTGYDIFFNPTYTASFSIYTDGIYSGYYSTDTLTAKTNLGVFSKSNLKNGVHTIKIVYLSGILSISKISAHSSCLNSVGNVVTENKKIAFVGDSITQGVGTNPGDGSMSYPAQVGLLLGPEYTVKNFGKGGSMILKDFSLDLSLWNYYIFDEVRNYQPDYIVIMFGTNDFRNGYSSNINQWSLADNYEGAVTELINLYSTIESRPKIYINTIPTLKFDDAERNSTFENGIQTILTPMLNRIVTNAKSKGISIELIDVYSATKDLTLDYFNDNVHPNNLGASVIAQTVASTLVPGFVTPINIALNKPIISSSGNFNGDWGEEKINDGSTGTSWASAATDNPERSDYVVIDLQNTFVLKNIILKNPSSFNYRSAKDFTIYSSPTGAFSGEETIIFSGTNPSSAAGMSFSAKINDIESRYVKLLVTSTYDPGTPYATIISELEIYGTPAE